MIPIKDNIPTDRFPLVTVLLIAINVAVFIFLQGPSLSGDQVKTEPVVEYGAIPYRITHPGKDCDIAVVAVQPGVATEDVNCEGKPPPTGPVVAVKNTDDPPAFLTLFTSMFMHGGWLHIIFNMLFLWIFGNNIEDSMGRLKFPIFYVLGGLAAIGLQIAVNADSTAPTVGASGAIAAVLGGYILLYPHARILTVLFIFFFFTFVEIPALVMLGIWLLLQFLPAVGQLATPDVGGGGVAYWAHIGGFLFGMATVFLFARRKAGEWNQPKYPVY